MDETLINLLNEALKSEHQAAYQYLNHYNNVRGKWPDIINHFKEHMEDEQNHANSLSARIYALGGIPTIQAAPIATFTEDVDLALDQDIIAEQQAIDLYSQIDAYCIQIKDFATQMLIEDILLTEVQHLDEFAKLREFNIS